jgi:hypothetical protein
MGRLYLEHKPVTMITIMPRRLLTLAFILALGLPGIARADDSSLGPATSTSGSSSADGGTLQPAGIGSVQSSITSGLSSSNDAASELQQPATADSSPSRRTKLVQNSNTPPLQTVTSDEKAGESSGKRRSGKGKKHGKKKPSRRRH